MTWISTYTLAQAQLAAEDEALAGEATYSPAAFGELYRRHFGRIYRYHLARTGNEPDAQDLTAQTFLAALEGVAGFRGSGSFAAWLMGIARRKVAQHYRSRRPQAPLEELAQLSDPALSPEAAAGQHLQFAHVSKALLALAPERSEAIQLCIFGDLTAAQAAQVMGKSEAAVKMLVFRGLRDLREVLGYSVEDER